MQSTNQHKLAFLKERIKNFNTALFSSEMIFEWKLPSCLIETLRVEEDGSICFFANCNNSYESYPKHSFYAELSYYKKETGDQLKVSGNAVIVNCKDQHDVVRDQSRSTVYNYVLIKLSIQTAELFETKKIEKISWQEKVKGLINSLFFGEANKRYNFS